MEVFPPDKRCPFVVTVILYGLTSLVGKTSTFHFDSKNPYDDIKDYNYHPCRRPCVDGYDPMVCQYDFLVEHYHTLSRACHKCPFVLEDCLAPDCLSVDGSFREIITVNRRLPGPPINVCEGDIIRVRVHNRLEMNEGVTIHWHGVLQRGTPYMDGVPMVTQCSIPTYTSFTYTFNANKAGTHFWHAHSGMQRDEGVFGQLVIRKPQNMDVHQNLYDIDSPDHTIVLSDWVGEESIVSTFARLHHKNNYHAKISILVNGRGAGPQFHDPMTGRNVTTPRAVFTVRSGFKYRFRMIYSGAFIGSVRLSITNHTMTVIASDGSPVEPVQVESINILSGERFDFIVNADQPIDTYMMQFVRLENWNEVYNTMLKYEGSSCSHTLDSTPPVLTGLELNPIQYYESHPTMDVTKLKSLDVDDPALTRPPDKTFTITLDIGAIHNPRYYNSKYYPLQEEINTINKIYSPEMNNIVMKTPSSPLLSQFGDTPKHDFCNAHTLRYRDCKKELCECIHRIKVDLGDVVEMILVDEGDIYHMWHPVHLHGIEFRVIAMEKLGNWTSLATIKKLDADGKIRRNLDRAPLKDSVLIPNGGYTVVRFYADNPGIWSFHCHNSFHSETGMTMVLQVGDHRDFPEVPPRFPTCGSWDGGGLGVRP